MGALNIMCAHDHGFVLVEPANGTLQLYSTDEQCVSKRWDCYFHPLTECPTIAQSTLGPHADHLDCGLGEHRGGMDAATAHMLRPKPALAAKVHAMKAKLNLTDQPYVSMQMRTGRRFMNDGRVLMSVEQYAQLALTACTNMHLNTLYVTTDDYEALEKLIGILRPHNVSVVFIPESLFGTEKLSKGSYIEDALKTGDLVSDYISVVATDVFIAAQGAFFIHSQSSFGDTIRHLQRERGDRKDCWFIWVISWRGQTFEFEPYF